MQQFKVVLDFFMEKCYNKLVIILSYLDLGTAVFKALGEATVTALEDFGRERSIRNLFAAL